MRSHNIAHIEVSLGLLIATAPKIPLIGSIIRVYIAIYRQIVMTKILLCKDIKTLTYSSTINDFR